MQKLNFKNFFYYSLLVLVVFLLDRVTKIYIINLAEINGSVDLFISPYINFYLIWNNGIGFGILSSDQSFFYNSITAVIIFINAIIIFMISKYNDFRKILLLMILGGSLGNLYDRIYFMAVPDFIDLHYMNFHWFIFNVADIFITLGIFCLIIAEVFINKDLKRQK